VDGPTCLRSFSGISWGEWRAAKVPGLLAAMS
jgi:hypothetical protein